MFIKILFSEQSVAANGKTVIGGVNDNCIISQPELGECPYNVANPVIEVCDEPVIIGQ